MFDVESLRFSVTIISIVDTKIAFARAIFGCKTAGDEVWSKNQGPNREAHGA